MYPVGTWFVWRICVWLPCIEETMMMMLIIILLRQTEYIFYFILILYFKDNGMSCTKNISFLPNVP